MSKSKRPTVDWLHTLIPLRWSLTPPFTHPRHGYRTFFLSMSLVGRVVVVTTHFEYPLN